MPQDSYPTPYREGVYQDGLRRAIMRRVSGPQRPTAAPMHVSGPLMGGGRLLRRRPGGPEPPARPGFPLRRLPSPQPMAPRGLFPQPQPIVEPLLGTEPLEGLGGEGERRGRTEAWREAWLQQLASRLPGLEGARRFLPEAEPDPWQAWLASIEPHPGGISAWHTTGLPEYPAAPGTISPEMMAELFRRLFPSAEPEPEIPPAPGGITPDALAQLWWAMRGMPSGIGQWRDPGPMPVDWVPKMPRLVM